MYVCCNYNNQNLVCELNKYEKDNYSYLNDDFWYQYVFIDNDGPSCKSKTMAPKLIDEATNSRWIDFEINGNCNGTLYGISRYSFVILGSDFSISHLQNIYSEMVILCLAQRACILKFSENATEISKGKITSEGVTILYKKYIEFRNRLFFREITAQDQGIEFYDLIQKQMRLAKEMKDLDEDLSELNQFIKTEDQARLTEIATKFLPATLVTAALALISDLHPIFTWSNKVPWELNWPAIFDFGLLIILIGLVYFFFKPSKK
jgi:hypothetical protein